jgi:arylsulfatase A-like enzyme/tetratricopeptide (TPR) repeat protein
MTKGRSVANLARAWLEAPDERRGAIRTSPSGSRRRSPRVNGLTGTFVSFDGSLPLRAAGLESSRSGVMTVSSRRAIGWLALFVLLGAFGGVLRHARRAPADTAEAIRGMWASRGVEKPKVVLVTLDTTRADRLGSYGYAGARTPQLDALARRGVVFEQAATTSPLTQPAHASILTGMYPTHHGVRVNGSTALGQSQRTLAELFRERGYETAAFVGAFVLDGRWGLNQGFQVYDDAFDLAQYKHLDLGSVQRPGNLVVDAALAWLETHRQAPFFVWVHLYDPHTPYEPPEPLRAEFGARGLAGLYDGEIAFADQQVGRCLSWLQASGLEERTIVLVVGDHGEGLGSHGEGTHGYFIYDYAQRVPFMVATPFRELGGVRVPSQVSTVDVLPTLLALCGIEPPAHVQGRSLLGAMRRPREERAGVAYGESMTPSLQYGWAPLQSLRTTRYKLIQAPRPELYDLVLDPGETTNVIARHGVEAEELRQRLERLVSETSRGAPEPEAADLDKETLESLAALGYVGGLALPKAAEEGRPLADPKDKLGVYAAVQEAGERIMSGDYAAAATSLERALGEEPEMPQALLLLGTSYSGLGRKREAKALFDRVLADDPSSVQALIAVANLLVDEGRASDVIALCKRTLAIDERNTQAYTLLGEVHAGLGRPAEALPYFEKAVAVQPKLTQNRLNLAASLVELKRYERAEQVLEEIVARYPRFPLAQYNLGLLLEEQGRLEEARAAYAAEVAAYPTEWKARFNLGRVLFRLGDRPAAIAEMREVVAVAPRRAEGHLFLARGLLLEGAPLDEIQPLVERGLSLAQAQDVRALGFFLMADVFTRRGMPESARQALRSAHALVPASNRGVSP